MINRSEKHSLEKIYRKLTDNTVPPAYLKWLAEQEEKKIYPKLYGKI